MAGTKALPELGVHMRAVSMRKPSIAEVVDPLAVDVDHALITRGFSVIRSSSPTKSPIGRALAREGRVAAIVVIDRIVEPGRPWRAPRPGTKGV
jgi:hypothetical protein